jgi:DNA-binding response OmpR family regulator
MNSPVDARPVILVADDDRDIQDLVAIRLERAGYRVLRADDGRRALELASSERPALAVLDVTMPHLDGYSVLHRLREDAATAEMPVILLTARVQDGDVAKGMAAGATAYVKKPFGPQELNDRIASILSAH